MQIISQEIRAIHASVPIKNSEVGWLLPIADMLRFAKVEDDRYSVFIVLANWPLIG